MAKSDILVRVTADPSAFIQAMGQVNGALAKVDREVKKTSAGFAALGSSLTNVGTGLTAAITLPLVGLGVASIKAAADMEVLTMGLKAVMKDAGATGVEMNKLKVIAKLPGIDLEGAVRGSIRLQTLGRSADSARDLMKELANAIAIAGGGKDDFAEVTRQLVQMQSVGKVTKENLDTITERIPQISKIMIDTWGPQSVGDPAKFFEKAGISSAQFIDIIKGKLTEGARAGDTFKNSMENAMQDFNLALVEVGETLKPLAQRMLNEFISPAIKGMSDLAKEFRSLDPTVQNSALIITGVAAALPVLITGLGIFLTNLTAVKTAMASVGLALTAAGSAIAAFGASAVATITNMAGVAAGTAGATAAIGLFYAGALVAAGSIVYLTNALYELWKAEDKAAGAAEAQSFAIEKLLDRVRKVHPEIGALEVRYRAGQISAADFSAELLRLAKGMDSTTVPAKAAKSSLDGIGKELEKVSNIIKVTTVMFDKGSTEISKTSLVFVESLERVKVAVGKVKNVMYEYSIAGTVLGKTLETIQDPMEEMALATEMYRKELQLLADVSKNVSAIKKPSGFPEMPQAQAPFPDLPGNKNISLGVILGGMNRQISDKFKETSKVARAAIQQVSLVVNDLARGITDVIFKGGKLGDMFKSVASQAAQSITRLLIEGALTKLTSKLFEVGGLMGKIFGGATSVGGSIFSAAAGGGASAAGSIAGGAASAGGAAASASSGIGGALAAANPVTAIVSAVSGVVSAISGIVSNFQFAAMNKSLDLIEREVRYSQIHLLYTLNKANEFWPYMKSCWESLIRMETRQMEPAGAVDGGMTVNMAGAFILSDAQLGDFADRLVRYIKARR